ncbi:Mpo1-like protein [uncultured Aquincola sp.]|uniref:Mpo1 family 2-hydroxy fatty acid dioxygenase n=1 Tax=uncultured Aquincola sp. TaxID=886556 RepID=UPI0032B2FD00|tara:strand:- start:728 stop:1255 length:528 start_codon:yes stop_codon:yes gene_type:complete
MRNTTELLAQYATYHRDRRNIATHFVGIPLIVFAVGVLLARPVLGTASVSLTPAWIVWGLATLWYLSRGQLAVGLAVSLLNALLVGLGHTVAGGSMAQWLGWGIGSFVLGWLIQFVGHYYEGRKPAFVDDLTGLLIGPMFVAAELLFSMGWCRTLLADIERRAGPTVLRDLHSPA